jgi:hypothetical protein
MSSLLPLAESFSMGKCARMTHVLALLERNMCERLRAAAGGGRCVCVCLTCASTPPYAAG